MISSNDLRNKSFSVVPSGYDIDEVNFIIDEAAKTIEACTKENEELYHKLEVLAAKVEEYREEEDSIKSALIVAQKMADKIKKESNEQAEALIESSKEMAREALDNANAQADKLISNAREYSANLTKEKTEEANKIVSDAQAKANEAISSAKIVAQDVLDQAKAISDDLIDKSKEEKEAYEILVNNIKNDANDFVSELKKLYTAQLDALNGVNFEVKSDESAVENVDSIQKDVDSLVNEIDEMEEAIPDEIKIDDMTVETVDVDPPVDEEPVVDDEPEEDDALDNVDEQTAVAVEDFILTENTPVDTDIEEIVIPDDEDDDETEVDETDVESEDDEDDEPADPMEAVEAFSTDEITPIKQSVAYVPVIEEEPDMEYEEKSLFDDEGAQLPFESYFNVKTEDAHTDRTQTISLVPPEDEDEKPIKGFFKKRK